MARYTAAVGVSLLLSVPVVSLLAVVSSGLASDSSASAAALALRMISELM